MISGVSAPIQYNNQAPAQLRKPSEEPVKQNQVAPPEKAAAKLGELTDAEKTQVAQLKKTDQEVRTHEQAHKNAGGQFAGSASYGYTVGPDGNRYAVSGEVPIDIAPVEGDPEATIAKMVAVAAAALAPLKPSGQDRRVAAQAAALRAEAQAELSRETTDEQTGEVSDTGEATNSLNLAAITAYEASVSFDNTQENSGRSLDLLS